MKERGDWFHILLDGFILFCSMHLRIVLEHFVILLIFKKLWNNCTIVQNFTDFLTKNFSARYVVYIV